MRKLSIFTALAITAASAAPTLASESISADQAARLNKAPAEYSWSAAAERRHMMIEESMRQQQSGRRSQPRDSGGYDHGYGSPRGQYRDRDYGPPPAPYAYDRRPTPRYGYDYAPPPPPYGYYAGPRW